MVASASTDFTEMVSMGICLEEVICEGRLSKDRNSSNGAKKYGDRLVKKKEKDSYAISHGKQRRSHARNHHQQLVASVSVVVNPTLAVLAQKDHQQHNQQNCT